METKKAKLMHQINYMIERKVVSDIFNGVSIFVNGYTSKLSLISIGVLSVLIFFSFIFILVT